MTTRETKISASVLSIQRAQSQIRLACNDLAAIMFDTEVSKALESTEETLEKIRMRIIREWNSAH